MPDFSRLNTTPEIVYKDHPTYGVWQQPDFLTATLSDDQIGTFVVTNQHEGKPGLISNAIYRTPLLDWVLLAFNKVREPLNWPKTGTIVKYPLESIVFPQLAK